MATGYLFVRHVCSMVGHDICATLKSSVYLISVGAIKSALPHSWQFVMHTHAFNRGRPSSFDAPRNTTFNFNKSSQEHRSHENHRVSDDIDICACQQVSPLFTLRHLATIPPGFLYLQGTVRTTHPGWGEKIVEWRNTTRIVSSFICAGDRAWC